MKSYGIVPKKIMQDKNISIQAKAVYAYLSSFADKENKCYPSYERMETELNVSKTSLSKYIKELIAKGYLTKHQSKDGGKYAHNVYSLFPSAKLPLTKNTDAEITVDENLDCNDTNHINNTNIIYNNTNINKYGEYENVILSDDELEALKTEYPEIWEILINTLSNYMHRKKKNYSNHLQALRSFANNQKKWNKSEVSAFNLNKDSFNHEELEKKTRESEVD